MECFFCERQVEELFGAEGNLCAKCSEQAERYAAAEARALSGETAAHEEIKQNPQPRENWDIRPEEDPYFDWQHSQK